MSLRRLALAVALGIVLSACSRHSEPRQDLAPASPLAIAELGQQIFNDPALSASGKMSCASCHSPQHAYAAPNPLPVQLGGSDLNKAGLRSVPSLRYTLSATPAWHMQHEVNPVTHRIEPESEPTGGFTRDGRFNTLHEQAVTPLFAANEMANTSIASLINKLKVAPYSAQFKRVYGIHVFENNEVALATMLDAIQHFELDDPSFRPYSSKYDHYLEGSVQLSDQELHGLALFNDPKKGNCNTCHISARDEDGSPPIFTDLTFANLGVPRNPNLPANVDPKFFDLGLCGPERKDLQTTPRDCGMFKTPTLRNVATRAVFMHNGVFTRLDDVVRFYAERDIHPAKWYPKAAGHIDKYNDLPKALRGNVNMTDAPFNRKATAKPVLSDADITDIVAFLNTLTDDDVVSMRQTP